MYKNTLVVRNFPYSGVTAAIIRLLGYSQKIRIGNSDGVLAQKAKFGLDVKDREAILLKDMDEGNYSVYFVNQNIEGVEYDLKLKAPGRHVRAALLNPIGPKEGDYIPMETWKQGWDEFDAEIFRNPNAISQSVANLLGLKKAK